MKKPNGSAIRLSRSILGIRPISVSYKLFPQSQLRRNKGLYNMVLLHRNTIDAAAFRFAAKTKPKPSAAGSVWRGGATECVRDDFCKKVVANDMQSATTWKIATL